MRLFNEETEKEATFIVLLESKTEAQTIVDMLAEAAKAKPRSKKWKRIAEEFGAQLTCF